MPYDYLNLTGLEKLIELIQSDTLLQSVVAAKYHPSKSYVVDDIILQDGLLYVCITPTTGTFDPTAWSQVTVEELLAAKQSAIADLDAIRSGATAGATAVQPAAMEAALNEKQDTLEFNPTIPSGVTPTALSMIKNGDNYYAPDGKQWTFLTSAMTDAERLELLQTATLPYVYLDNYIFTHRDYYDNYVFAQLRINVTDANTPTLDNLQLKEMAVNGHGKIINTQYLSGTTSLDQYNFSNQKVPSAQAVMKYVDNRWTTKQDKITTTSIADGTITTSLGFDAAGNVVKGQSQGQQKKILTFTSAELETFLTNMGSMLEFSMPISAYTSEFQNADAITLQSEDATTINFTLYRVQLLHDGESDTDIVAFVGSAVIPGYSTYDFVLVNGTITVRTRITIKEYSTDTQYNEYDICLYTGRYYLCEGATRGEWDSSKWTTLYEAAELLTTPVQTLSLKTGLALLRKQDSLVSGTNIKTINGNSVLGEGNLTIDTVTETRVQEMIDASISSVIGEAY